jgi:hypothetical protein
VATQEVTGKGKIRCRPPEKSEEQGSKSLERLVVADPVARGPTLLEDDYRDQKL